MTNSSPEDRKVNDTQIIDGKMSSWNGKGWEVPRENDVWFEGPGELYYWDGKEGWVLYEGPPESPGGDPVPSWVYKLYRRDGG
jgi:hypothetical protein